MRLHLVVLLVLRSWTIVSGNLSSEMQSWCAYVASNPEPEVLIYNMVPKTASTALRSHVKVMRRKKVKSYLFPHKYFLSNRGDLDSNPSLAKSFDEDFIKIAYAARNESKKLFGTGHFAQHIVPMNFTTEAINTMRDCHSRFSSHIEFDLFSCPNARAYQKKHPEDTDGAIWLLSMMRKGNDTDPWKCAKSFECLKSTFYGQNLSSGYMSKFFSGGITTARYGSSYDGAIRNIKTHEYKKGGFVYVGVQERMEESLEVLNCLYPSYFAFRKHHSNLLLRNQRNAVGNSTAFMSLPSVQELIDKVGCSDSDDRVYEEVLRLHVAKYDAIQRYPERCCRKT